VIFSELYSAYYNAVARILKAALTHPLQKEELRQIVEEQAFGESILSIEPSLTEGKWQLLKKDGTTPIRLVPSMPLTTIQKRWLKAISLDPRIRMFSEEGLEFPDVEPLFRPEDVCVFDQYADGDNYRDETYRKNFRLILDAVRNRYPLSVEVANRRGSATRMVVMPEYLEYSEKDDKFRLIGHDRRHGRTINLGRMIACRPCTASCEIPPDKKKPQNTECVEFELENRRNALERVLLHFAHFEKRAERLDDHHYKVSVRYDKDDETEMVIRILSFGPMVKVMAPSHFVNLIKERLISQKSCGL